MSQQYQLSFRSRILYEQQESGIPLRVVLRAGDEDFECLACIDTGATACLFQREVGESLGLDIEAGLPQRFDGRFSEDTLRRASRRDVRL